MNGEKRQELRTVRDTETTNNKFNGGAREKFHL